MPQCASSITVRRRLRGTLAKNPCARLRVSRDGGSSRIRPACTANTRTPVIAIAPITPRSCRVDDLAHRTSSQRTW